MNTYHYSLYTRVLRIYDEVKIYAFLKLLAVSNIYRNMKTQHEPDKAGFFFSKNYCIIFSIKEKCNAGLENGCDKRLETTFSILLPYVPQR